MAAITEVDESELESDDTNDGGDLDRAALKAQIARRPAPLDSSRTQRPRVLLW